MINFVYTGKYKGRLQNKNLILYEMVSCFKILFKKNYF